VLIDAFLPTYDFNEVHSLEVDAPAARLYDILTTADLRRPFIIRLLMGIRSLPSRLAGAPADPRAISLRHVEEIGFTLLGENPPHEIVVGVEGKFWKLDPEMCSPSEVNLGAPVPAGRARAIWNFTVAPITGARSRLTTETRIQCGDEDSRRRFGRYWRFVQPGSGLIRMAILRHVASEARRT
jgi:hypothetical protein